MVAGEQIEKRQRETELGPRGDRIQAVFASLTPVQPVSLEKMRKRGALAAGEVNDPLPNAKTFHYGDKSHAVVVFSGLIDFYESASKILFGATNLFIPGKVLKTELSLTDVISQLAELFSAWTPEGISAERMASMTQTALPPLKLEDAAVLTEAALKFIISHEFGHVLFYKAPRGKKPATKLTAEQEFLSDGAGVRNMIMSARGGPAARMSLAGSILALRTLAVFGQMGHQFVGDHPPPLDRIKNVMGNARALCKTERDFWSLSPIAYAYDEMLEDAGVRALHHDARPPLLADRCFSRLSAVLEEVVKGSQSDEDLIKTMNFDFDEATDSVLETVAAFASTTLPEVPLKTEVASEDELWAAKAQAFRELMVKFPRRAQTAFEQAYANPRQAEA